MIVNVNLPKNKSVLNNLNMSITKCHSNLFQQPVKFRFIAGKILKVFSIAFVLLLALCLNSNADEAGCPRESQDQNSGLLADNSVPNSSASSVASANSSSMMPLPKY